MMACWCFVLTYIKRLVGIVFSSYEWGLNDVQVSSCYCHWSMSTEKQVNIVLTDHDLTCKILLM